MPSTIQSNSQNHLSAWRTGVRWAASGKYGLEWLPSLRQVKSQLRFESRDIEMCDGPSGTICSYPFPICDPDDDSDDDWGRGRSVRVRRHNFWGGRYIPKMLPWGRRLRSTFLDISSDLGSSRCPTSGLTRTSGRPTNPLRTTGALERTASSPAEGPEHRADLQRGWTSAT